MLREKIDGKYRKKVFNYSKRFNSYITITKSENYFFRMKEK